MIIIWVSCFVVFIAVLIGAHWFYSKKKLAEKNKTLEIYHGY